VLGLPEWWVGLAILIALVVDALSDPVVGHLSDHWHSRFGRRHPFMYASAVPVGISFYLLWNPPAALGPEALFVWLVVVAIVVRTFITFYEIPSSSLVAELTQSYDERTSLLGVRYFFGWWGGLTMAILAFRVFLRPDADHPVGILNPHGYADYGIAAGLIMTATILLSAGGTHSFIPRLKQPPPKRRRTLGEHVRELRDTLSNRSFRFLFGGTIFAAMAAGLTAALNVYFATYFWELDTDEIALVVMTSFVSAALAFAIAPQVSRRFGKKHGAIGVSLVALAIGPMPIVLRLLDLFPENDSPALLPMLAAFNVVVITLFIVTSILSSAMVADVVEESELTTGRRSEGLFFAALSFVQKCVSGIGVLASTLLLGAIGFPRGARPGEVPEEVVRALGLVFTPLLVVLLLISIAFLAGYGIDRDSHEANLRRLAADPPPTS
jgi:glycoside/pentoside/hexuronide:cation symporter, GPH family